MGNPEPKYRTAWIRALFDRIAGRYDLLNDLLSLGVHRVWKARAITHLGLIEGDLILDAATGTGDLALQLERAKASVIGVDFSSGMLEIARKRKPLGSRIDFLLADIHQLPFQSSQFDGVIVSFGVRNLENPDLGVAELWRVLKPGGRLVILEFGNWSAVAGFSAFLRYFSDLFGADGEAYSHLVDSSLRFPAGKTFITRFLSGLNGSMRVTYQKLFFGIAHIYAVTKVEITTAARGAQKNL
ncbi:MAG: ubiquinone/menaquinone biosynthesis methyltransferase [Bdellovibrionales bacterium]|nr:ubiquinone/menaquinone biosynthesis methyltransferase [Bdellovibrionales bacterium]